MKKVVIKAPKVVDRTEQGVVQTMPSMDDVIVTDVGEAEFSLEEMQATVGGLIEILGARTEDRYALVIDDEGLLKQKPINPIATILAMSMDMIAPGTVLVGDVLVAFDTGDELKPFSDQEAATVEKILEKVVEMHTRLVMQGQIGEE